MSKTHDSTSTASPTLLLAVDGAPIAHIAEVGRYEGQRVQVRGWLRRRRSKGKLHFLVVRDGSGEIQAVVSKRNVSDEVFERVGSLTTESSFIVTGTVKADERAPSGFELSADGVEIVHLVEGEFPISPKAHGTAFLMDHRHLWLRSRRQHAVLHVRAQIIRSIRDYFDDAGYLLLDTPIFTPAACEGTTTLFETAYHEQTAYLSQSGQLYNEANAMAFGRVYTFGPTFRAEKSKTRRHLTEFWMVEPEAAYIDLAGVMSLAEGLVLKVASDVLERCGDHLDVIDSIRSEAEDERGLLPRREALAKIRGPFPRLDYADAIERLQALGSDIAFGEDLGGDDETLLTREFDTPIFVHRYPAAIKAFYMKKDAADPVRSLSVDMLAPEGYGEIVGGGQREDDHQTLVDAIDAHGLPQEAFDWYLDLRRYGSVPHGGFGLGLERTVAWICGVPHVRETIPFPRLMDRLKP